ncbi:hypothetical protein [Bradyrhizobium sp. USDA 313]
MSAMAEKPDDNTEGEDKARTEEAQRLVKEHADQQRELQDKLRRKLN